MFLIRVECGETFTAIARSSGLTPSSVRSSVLALQKHLHRYAQKNHELLATAGNSSRGKMKIIAAFADHIGARLDLRKAPRSRSTQRDLF